MLNFFHVAARSVIAITLLTLTFALPGAQTVSRAAEPAADACDAPVQTVASRTVAMGEGMLNDIAVAPDGLWAVGSTKILDTRYQQPLIQRWDGAAWRTLATPTYTTPGTFLEGSALLLGVGVAAPNDVWAVGFIGLADFAGDEALILRWDGVTWNRMPNTGALSSFT